MKLDKKVIASIISVLVFIVGALFMNNTNDNNTDNNDTQIEDDIHNSYDEPYNNVDSIDNFSNSADDNNFNEEDIYNSVDNEDEIVDENELASDASVSEELLSFRNNTLLEEHFEKHGIEMGFSSAKEYEMAAAKVVNNPNALHKTEAEDFDDVYYIENTNEFVIVSTDGYIRTYFNPRDGIDYYNRQ